MAEKKKILGVITARGGSKGIPGKNIKPLGGKPLIAYTIEAAKKSNLITHCIISTDDEAIAAVCREFGAEVPFMRPKELAQDNTPHLPVMQHAIHEMEQRLGIQFDYTVIFQPTSPFRASEDIDATLEKLVTSGADSAVTLVEVTDPHPMKIKRLEGNRVTHYSIPEVEGMRRQDLPTAYKRSGDVYAMKRDVIMGGSLYGKHQVGHIVPKERAVDIDEPFDWIRAEHMLKELREKGYDL